MLNLRTPDEIALDFDRLSFTFDQFTKCVNKQGYELSDNLIKRASDPEIRSTILDILSIKDNAVDSLRGAMSTYKGQNLLLDNLKKWRRENNPYIYANKNSLHCILSDFSVATNYLLLELSLSEISAANGNLTIAQEKLYANPNFKQDGNICKMYIFNSAAGLAQANGLKVKEAKHDNRNK